MDKLEYLAALKSALAGLPPELITDMLNAYELRFIEGASLGRSEQEIVQGLDTPQAIATRLKANMHYTPPLKSKPPETSSASRKFFAIAGLGVFNFFMIFPSILFFVLLFASFTSSLAFVIGGSAFTAASLANVNQITLKTPKTMNKNSSPTDAANESAAGAAAGTTTAEDDFPFDDKELNEIASHIRGKHGKQFEPSIEVGIGLIITGILLFLLNLVITKYTFIGIKRYLMLNYSIIKNA
jgi:uncharacterized membrane protein